MTIMNREEIIEKLTSIFRSVFKDETILLEEELTADDIETWDSLTHMSMITEVEKQFGIKFKLRELNKLKKVGDLINIIESRV